MSKSMNFKFITFKGKLFLFQSFVYKLVWFSGVVQVQKQKKKNQYKKYNKKSKTKTIVKVTIEVLCTIVHLQY